MCQPSSTVTCSECKAFWSDPAKELHDPHCPNWERWRHYTQPVLSDKRILQLAEIIKEERAEQTKPSSMPLTVCFCGAETGSPHSVDCPLGPAEPDDMGGSCR